ncbi:MAG: hypothetical protein M5U26_20905 [Planctomycetota bacterium]|nr:hypothetical protein [Planctomycetota bacterium]
MRFVVLHHTGWPGHDDHYDLMLQTEPGAGDADAVLRTFASLTDEFPDGRSHADARQRDASATGPDARANLLRLIDDHRRAYLNLEGGLSGGRGRVERIDAGELAWLQPPDADSLLFRFELSGARLKGGFRLRHMGGGIYAFERLRRVPN